MIEPFFLLVVLLAGYSIAICSLLVMHHLKSKAVRRTAKKCSSFVCVDQYPCEMCDGIGVLGITTSGPVRCASCFGTGFHSGYSIKYRIR